MPQLMTLTFRSQGTPQKITCECGVIVPSGLALLALRAPFGAKTNDESFANYTQLSPVLMPSLALRDISCLNDFRTFKVKITKAKKPKRLSAFGNKNTLNASHRGKGESASLAFSHKNTKDERPKSKPIWVSPPPGPETSFLTPSGEVSRAHLATLGDKSTKDERLKGQGRFASAQPLKPKG